MSVAVRRPGPNARFYPDTYTSDGVSSDAGDYLRVRSTAADDSVSCGFRQADLFQQVVDARDLGNSVEWIAEGAEVIGNRTVASAIKLLYALPTNLRVPVITPEITGEIAFEWFRDARHVAVITVDGDYIRWSAMLGTDRPVSGREPFTDTLPGTALDIVNSV